MKIRFLRLPPGRDLPAPRRATAGSAGFDLRAALEAPLVLHPGQRVRVPSGFACEIPRGFEIQVRPRSGLALRHGITVANAPGTIDSDYRGEIQAILIHHGNEPHTLERGARIAQLVIARVVEEVEWEEVEKLEESGRGTRGFGSSGVK